MTRGVFCVEGSWYPNKLHKPDSVRPMLEMLRDDGYPIVHRDCGTSSDLFYYLDQWLLKRYSRFQVLYLAFHGKPGLVEIGNENIKLDAIVNKLYQKCRHKVVVFGTCATLSNIKDMRQAMWDTRAELVCGYRDYVPWIPSTALDMAVLHTILEGKFTPAGFVDVAKRIKSISAPFKLGLRAMTRYE